MTHFLTPRCGAAAPRSAFEAAEDGTDLGGVVGATVGVRLGRMLSFYVAAEDYFYGTRLEGTTLGEESRTRNDIRSPSASVSRSGADARTSWLARNPQLDSGCGDYQFRSSFAGDM